MNQSPRPPSTTWDTLPFEVRDRILYYFCFDVINEYTQLTADIRDAKGDFHNSEDRARRFLTESNWADHIACLPNFSAVLRTSRYFHHAMTATIKFDGKSALETLRTLHPDRTDAVFTFAEHIDGYHELPLSFVPRMVGNFSENLCVNPPFGVLFPSIRLATLLIPFLEEWILQHATSTQPNHKRPITLKGVDPREGCNIPRKYDFMPGSFEFKGNNTRILDGTSIARPARLEDCHAFPNCDRYHQYSPYVCVCPPPPDFLMVREICKSKPDTWWLFTGMDSMFLDTSHVWFLVNYKEKKMFRGPDMANGMIWDDSWDENNWHRYKLRRSARNDPLAGPSN